jgi:MoxR-like ATPase
MTIDVSRLSGRIAELSDGTTTPRRVHLFDGEEVDAVEAALRAERPLLLRGEPGGGKSQLAEAVAKEMGWEFVKRTVDGNTDPDELKWTEDTVERLSRAQFAAHPKAHDNLADLRNDLERRNYVKPGVLWQAFDWTTAHPGSTVPQRVVVLIDEIDKADSAVPNALLEALGSAEFTPPGHAPVTAKVWPLVILTTNEDRPLPPAFLRRCLVHRMDPPKEKLDVWLFERGKALFADAPEEILREAAKVVIKDRKDASQLPLPGLAEYLDLLRALLSDGERDMVQLTKTMTRIQKFFLDKTRGR